MMDHFNMLTGRKIKTRQSIEERDRNEQEFDDWIKESDDEEEEEEELDF